MEELYCSINGQAKLPAFKFETGPVHVADDRVPYPVTMKPSPMLASYLMGT